MSCIDTGDCFEIEYDPAGVILRPAIDPSAENGLVCRTGAQPGLWDPDEQATEVCADIHGTIQSLAFNNTTNVSLPIFVGLTVTNPSATMVAQVWWNWWVEQSRIYADPGVRGTIVTQTSIFPNPLVDVGYHVWDHGFSVASAFVVPGAVEGFGDCPTPLAPGASATRVWGYRFEGAGAPGSWFAQIGPLHASALVVTVPS